MSSSNSEKSTEWSSSQPGSEISNETQFQINDHLCLSAVRHEITISTSVSERVKSEPGSGFTSRGRVQKNDLLLSPQLSHEPVNKCCCAGLCFNPAQWSDQPQRQSPRYHTTMGCLFSLAPRRWSRKARFIALTSSD